MATIKINLTDYVGETLTVTHDDGTTERATLRAVSGSVALVIFPDRADIAYKVDDTTHHVSDWGWVDVSRLTLSHVPLSTYRRAA